MIHLKLTEEEAAEVLLVLLNGYGDGDYYGLNHPARLRRKGWRARNNAYGRAVDKLQQARKLAHLRKRPTV